MPDRKRCEPLSPFSEHTWPGRGHTLQRLAVPAHAPYRHSSRGPCLHLEMGPGLLTDSSSQLKAIQAQQKRKLKAPQVINAVHISHLW